MDISTAISWVGLGVMRLCTAFAPCSWDRLKFLPVTVKGMKLSKKKNKMIRHVKVQAGELTLSMLHVLYYKNANISVVMNTAHFPLRIF